MSSADLIRRARWCVALGCLALASCHDEPRSDAGDDRSVGASAPATSPGGAAARDADASSQPGPSSRDATAPAVVLGGGFAYDADAEAHDQPGGVVILGERVRIYNFTGAWQPAVVRLVDAEERELYAARIDLPTRGIVRGPALPISDDTVPDAPPATLHLKRATAFDPGGGVLPHVFGVAMSDAHGSAWPGGLQPSATTDLGVGMYATSIKVVTVREPTVFVDGSVEPDGADAWSEEAWREAASSALRERMVWTAEDLGIDDGASDAGATPRAGSGRRPSP